MLPFRLRHLESDQDYRAGFDVMRELRPHLADAASFTAQVHRQARHGYRILAAWRGDQIKALAGYRLTENTLYGPFLYVDDLVVSADVRRHAAGARLLDALREEARAHGCAHVVLDTALANPLAHRFYFRQGLLAVGMHFCQPL